MSENIHKGHRERVKKEFLSNGFSEDTPDHKILELILFYTVPQKDTNPLAHELINKFGSLAGVFDAPVSEIIKIKGISENSAVLFKMFLPIARRYFSQKRGETPNFTNVIAIGNFLNEKY